MGGSPGIDGATIRPDAVFDGRDLQRGVALRVADLAIVPPSPSAIDVAGIVSPGLVDLQVNGGGGVLLNADPSPDGLAAIIAAHRRLGTAWLLPTVITDAPEVAEAAGDAVQGAWGLRGLAGLHLEGPHIAPARRGTHDARHIRALDNRTMALAARLRQAGIPLMITLAPEAADAQAITALARMGVVVALGHSDATEAEADAAFAAGGSCVTHLFNAMSQMQGRAPGLTGAAILSRADVGMICDGIHVSDSMLRLAIAAHGADRCHIVSDAMPTVGGPDHFTLYGRTIRVRDGALVNDEGNLAGAHTTMAAGVARLVQVLGLDWQTALRMAITNPARVIGLDPSLTAADPAEALVWQDGAARPLLAALS